MVSCSASLLFLQFVYMLCKTNDSLRCVDQMLVKKLCVIRGLSYSNKLTGQDTLTLTENVSMT
jgi:hypothetical protein